MARARWMTRIATLVLLVTLLVLPISMPVVAAQGEATLTAEPTTGPPGTVFQLRANGLPPGVRVLASIRGPTGRPIASVCLGTVERDGVVLLPPWTAGPNDQVGTYSVQITDADEATVMATGAFTVTHTASIWPASKGPAAHTPDAGAVAA